MAAAYSNSLQALNGIYGALDGIIKILSTSNGPQAQQEKAKNDVKTLNKGGLGGVQEAEKSSGSKAPITSASVKDMTSALLGLPPAIRAVAGLGNRPIRNVVNVLEKLNSAFAALAVSNDAVKGTIALKNLADSLVKLQDVKFFSLILSFTVLDKAKVGEKIGRVFKDIMSSYKSLGDITKEDMQAFEMFADGTTKLTTTAKKFALMLPLMPMFVLSAAMFSPGLKILGNTISKMPEQEKVKSAVEAANILNTFTKSATIVILSSIVLAASFKTVGKSEMVLALGITTTVITLLGGLAVAVTKTAAKSKNSAEQLKNVNEFIENLAFTTGLIYGVSILYVIGQDIIKPGLLAVSLTILSLSGLAVLIGMAAKLMHMRRSLRRVTNFIRSIVLMTGAVMALSVFAAVAKEPIVAGLGIVTGIILGLTLITMLVGALSLITNNRGMLSVLGIAAFSLALVLGTMLIGAIVTVPGAVDMLLLGLGTVTGVLLAYTLIAMIAGILGIVVDALSPALMGVIKIAGFSLGLVLGTILIGAVVTQGWDLLLIGLGGVLGTMLAFEVIMILTGKVAAKAKILEMSGAWNDLIMFAGGALLLTLGVVALGGLIHRVGPLWVLTSLVTTAVILYGLKLIANEAINLGRGNRILRGINALKQIGIFAGEVLAITAGVVIVAKIMEGIDQKWLIAASFGLMSAVMWEAYALAKAATINKPTIDKGIIDFKSTILLMAAGEGLAFGLLGLAKALEYTDFKHIAAAFGLIIAILTEAYVVAKIASKNEAAIRKGTEDIKEAVILMGAAEVLGFGIVGLAKSLEFTDFKHIAGAFGLITTILTEAYVLARTATKFESTIEKGAKDIGLSLVLMAGAELVAGGVILLARALEQTSGKKVLDALGLMTAIVAAAGVLAWGASKIEKDIVKGTIAIALCEALLLGSVVVLRAAIKTVKTGEELLGEKWAGKTLNALGEMALIVGATGALAFAAGALVMGPQALLFAAGAAALLACESLVMNGATMLTAVIEVTKQAEGVDFEKIKSTFTNMKSVIRQEAGLMKEATKNISALLLGGTALKKINKIIDSTCETISKFIMLSTYMEKAGMDPATLPDQIGKVLSSISPDIFTTLFNDGFLKTAVKIQAGYKSYSKILNIVKSALDMYANFIKTTKGKKIDGEVLLETSTAIAESLNAFMTALSGKTIDINKKTVKKLSKALGELVEPISNFAELITKYTGEDDTLAIITYDQNGVAHVGQKVNVVKTASILIDAVMAFCKTLYNDKNKEAWKEISGTKKGEQGSLEAGIGVFAAIIDPVAKFAEVLTKFENGGEDTLTIPEYDENGNLKPNSRKVNVVNVSRMLANAVTTFIEELYVNHMDQWKSVLTSLNMIDPSLAEGEEKAGNNSGIREAIGVFGEILNPILNFASVLLKFGTDKDSLTVFDEQGKPHKVNIEAVSTGIASAVTQFIQKISGIFTPDIMESISRMNENSVSVLNVLNGFVDNVSNASQIDQKKLIEATKTIPSFVKAFSDSIVSLNTSIAKEDIKVFENSFKQLNTALTTFIRDTYNQQQLEEFGISTTSLKEHMDKLVKGLFTAEDIESFETTVTDFIEFINSSFDKLLTTINADEKYNNFLNTNTELATGIKDSLNTLFSTLSVGEQLEEFVKNSTDYKRKISDTLDKFLKDFIQQESLDTFTNNVMSFKEVLNSSIDKVFGSVSLGIVFDKILLFTQGVKAAVSGMLKSMIQPEDVAGFTSSMNSISVSIQGILGSSIPDDSMMRFEHIMNTIKASTEILANEKTITDTDKFNKNLETLMNNISSASEASKVKKVTSLGNAVKTTTGEMTKFDGTLKNGNKARIAELNEFGKAVGNVSNRLNSAKDGLAQLKSVLTSIENADTNKITSLTEAISTSAVQAEQKVSGGVSIDYNRLARAFAIALSTVFDQATIESPEGGNLNSADGTITYPTFKLNVEDAVTVPDKLSNNF